jgi:hypothetical protein
LVQFRIAVPDALAKALSLYLMMAIGLKRRCRPRKPWRLGGADPGPWWWASRFRRCCRCRPMGCSRLRTPLRIKATAAAVSRIGVMARLSVVTFAAAVGQLNATNTPYEGFHARRAGGDGNALRF